MRERDTAEPACPPTGTPLGVLGDTAVTGQLVASPEHQNGAASLEEDGLLELLALPAQPLVERPGTPHVPDTQCDQTDPLLHERKVPGRFLRRGAAFRTDRCGPSHPARRPVRDDGRGPVAGKVRGIGSFGF